MGYYAVERTDSLSHYGRLGMKWYQHIFGEYNGTAKYAAKGQKKLAKMKEANKKNFPKIAAKTMKLSTKQHKSAVKAAKYYRVGRDDDARNEEYKAAKYEEAVNNLQNEKFRAINRTAKMQKKVHQVEDTLKNLDRYSGRDYEKAVAAGADLNKEGKYYLYYNTTNAFTSSKTHHVKEISDDYAKNNLEEGGEHGLRKQDQRIRKSKGGQRSK